MKATSIVIFLFLFSIGINVLGQDKATSDNIETTGCLAHDTIVQVVVEKSAKFQEGDLSKFRNYVMLNIRYPLEANINSYSGKSHIKFVVDWDGQVKDVTVYKSSGYKVLDVEAVRVIKRSPLWTSAKTNNVCVPQQFVLPVTFVSLGVINK
jgi:protein TonB